VIVRAATPSDSAAIVSLDAEVFGPDAWSAKTVEQTLATDHVVLVADDGIGYVVASVAGEAADLQRVAVAPARRREGIAHTLLSEATTAARDAGAQRMLLEVRADNTGALAFYAVEGFTEIDRRRRYYRDGADAIVLERALGQGR
jgi:ribosomal-protein-alanine N-acetyltransferase